MLLFLVSLVTFVDELSHRGLPLDLQGAYGDAGSERHIKLGGLADHLATIKRGRRIIFVACGTSFHACLAARQVKWSSNLLDIY